MIKASGSRLFSQSVRDDNAQHSLSKITAYLREERGSKDYRMILCMLAVWSGSLLAQLLFKRCSRLGGARSETLLPSSAQVVRPYDCLALCLLGGVIVGTFIVRRFVFRNQQRASVSEKRNLIDVNQFLESGSMLIGCQIILLLVAFLVAMVSSTVYCLRQEKDIAIVLASKGIPVVDAQVTVLTSPLVSERREYDCAYDVQIESVLYEGVIQNSHVRSRLYASGLDCQARRTGRYVVRAQLRKATFGRMKTWLSVIPAKTLRQVQEPASSSVNIQQVSPPTRLSELVITMQESFIRLTRHLDDQGKVLVPGLTIGVMGQDIIADGQSRKDYETNSAVVPAFARQLSLNFKKVGIMHLMAVSGSHFLLLGTCVRKICLYLRFKPWFRSLLMVVAYIGLAAIMYPSDSVLRALIMGILAAIVPAFGRRPQAHCTLSWTAIVVILCDPPMACSFGFALSCAAVLAITLWIQPVSNMLGRYLPRCLAVPLSVTLLAQAATLPIQILMDAQVPVFSPIGNVLVAPFVDFSTLCGLFALLVAWCLPQLALLFVYAASWGTEFMATIANLLSGSPCSTLPWPEGIVGALSAVLVEIAVVNIVRTIMIWRKWQFMDYDSSGNLMLAHRYRRSIWQRLSWWWKQNWDCAMWNA